MQRYFISLGYQLISAIAALAACFNANASQTICIAAGDSLTIKNTLAGWAIGSNDVVIELEQGAYDFSGGPYQYGNGDSGSTGNLAILGGYKPGTHCASAQRTLQATNTVLDGHNTAGSGLTVDSSASVQVEGLTFQNMQGSGDGTGVFVGGFSSGNLVLVDYIIVTNVHAGLQVSAYNDIDLVVHDSLFASNTGSGLTIYTVDGSTTAVAYNDTIVNTSGDGLVFDDEAVSDGGPIYVENIISWGNTGKDIRGISDQGSPGYTVEYSDYSTIAGPVFADPSTNIHVNPDFISLSNFKLQTTPTLSPAINAGAPINAYVPIYPIVDLAGKPRVVGGAIDMGAYESSIAHLFYVTNTGDDGGTNPAPGANTGTLRQAIVDANAYAAAAEIDFKLTPNNCAANGPQLIEISKPYPDVGYPLTIDGYTQSGSAYNTSTSGFNATLCVGAYTLTPATATYAFRTTSSNSKLALRGLVLGGFSGAGDAPISLAGGSGHAIGGNQIGGLLVQNYNGVNIAGNAGFTIVGGFDSPAATNLIIDSSNAGVQIKSTAGGADIANNLIGIGGDDKSPAGNATGVLISGSPNNYVAYNQIDNNSLFGVVVEGASATGNSLQYNLIGVNAAGAAAGNGGPGVYINAADTKVGVAYGQSEISGGNIIARNSSQGVWVGPTLAGNSILGNSIFGNDGLSIDLGASGPSANGTTVQAYPRVKNAFYTAATDWLEFTLDNSAALGNFQIDAFSFSDCSTLGSPVRGIASSRITTATIKTDINGSADVWVRLPAGTVSGDISATATATDNTTSEIGECTPASNDLIFRDNFGG